MTDLRELGRYRVLAPIGHGGMSTVFAAEHKILRRPVAIKVLHPHLVGDGAMARRMLDEAHTMAALHHPGIVEVLDVGMTDDGRTWVAMERLTGEALSDILERDRIPEERAITFGRQLASALAAAHAFGVIHRDLKPENIFIIADPDVLGGERVKVLDFGIAKRDVDGRERTLTGVVLGTPAYMAPEQCASGGEVDARTDVYALGVVLYLMVTGALPFAGECTDEIFAEHAFCAPMPPGSLAPVSPGLAAIIERCLAKTPRDRYASMDEVGDALADLAGLAYEDERTSVDEELRQSAVTEPLPVAVAVEVAALPTVTTTSGAHALPLPPRPATVPAMTMAYIPLEPPAPASFAMNKPAVVGRSYARLALASDVTTAQMSRIELRARRSWRAPAAFAAAAVVVGVAAALLVHSLSPAPHVASPEAAPVRAADLEDVPADTDADAEVNAEADATTEPASRASRRERRDRRDREAARAGSRAATRARGERTDGAERRDRGERAGPVETTREREPSRPRRPAARDPQRAEAGRAPVPKENAFATVAPPTLY